MNDIEKYFIFLRVENDATAADDAGCFFSFVVFGRLGSFPELVKNKH